MAKNTIADLDTTAANNTDVLAQSTSGSTLANKLDDMIRNTLALLARFYADIGGTGTVAGTADAITLTTASTYQALETGIILAFKAGSANTGAATLNVDSLGVKAIRRKGDAALSAGDIAANGYYLLAYDAAYNSAAGAWVLLNPEASGDVTTDGTQTLTNKTLTTPTLTLKQGAAPAPTAEGDIQWDTDDNALVVGDGAATKTFLPIPASTAAGDIEYYSAAKVKARLAKGTDGQILTLASGLPSWAAAPSSGQPVPTSSAFAVGTLLFCAYTNATGLPNGSSTSGANLKPAVGAAGDLSAGDPMSGTWKNVSGVQVSSTVKFGHFVRTA